MLRVVSFAWVTQLSVCSSWDHLFCFTGSFRGETPLACVCNVIGSSGTHSTTKTQLPLRSR